MSQVVTSAPTNLSERCVELFKSGRNVWWIVGEESCTYHSKFFVSRRILNKEREERGQDPVQFLAHDRWSGFYPGSADIPRCTDKSAELAVAIQLAVMTAEEIQERYPNIELQFDPTKDLIVLFKTVDKEINDQPLTLTLIRNICQSNMCSETYTQDKQNGQRGRRMLIFVTPTTSMPVDIPELKPEIIPLPDYDSLKNIVRGMMNTCAKHYEESKGKGGLKPLEDADKDRLINSLAGMTTSDAEETFALALARHWSYHDLAPVMDSVLQTIEDEKAKTISQIPGLRYIPKSDIVDHCPPGYELLDQWLDDRLKISTEKAKKHGIAPVRGLTLGGVPGTAKTEVAKRIARKLGRTCIIASIGEMKGSLVGESEKHLRQALQIGRAVRAVMVWDDIDKGALGGAAKGYNGDGGTTGNMVSMMLTEMSDPTSDTVHVFTFNRVPDLPELLRPGRIDKRFAVTLPNGPTRLAIIKDHIARVGMTVIQETLLNELAFTHTKDWTGAEIAHVLVKDEAVSCLADDVIVMNVTRMIESTKGFVPMARQSTFAKDLKEMEEACSQFTKIGNLPGTEAVVTAGPSKSKRHVTE